MHVNNTGFYSGLWPFVKAHCKQLEHILGTLFIWPAKQVTICKLRNIFKANNCNLNHDDAL